MSPYLVEHARVESRSMSVQDDGRYLVELCTGRIKVHVSADGPIWLNYARVESRSIAIWLNYARVESRSMSVQDLTVPIC